MMSLICRAKDRFRARSETSSKYTLFAEKTIKVATVKSVHVIIAFP